MDTTDPLQSMSGAGQAVVAQLQAEINELEISFPGLTATKYLSAAGFIILLYDHLLLFGEETRRIWRARLSWSKALFLINRYTVPLFITNLAGYRVVKAQICRTWLNLATFLGNTSLAIATIFVVQRVHALWGHSKRVLAMVLPGFVLVYATAFTMTGIAIRELKPHISYNPVVKTCVLDKRPTLYIAGYAAPICFDLFLFGLTCWNALDRPRHMHTALVKQLYLDGGVFFVTMLSLRLFNIIVFAVAPLPYVQLGVYFLWAMITAVINRMLVTIGSTLVGMSQHDSCGRGTKFEHFDMPLETMDTWDEYDDMELIPMTERSSIEEKEERFF